MHGGSLIPTAEKRGTRHIDGGTKELYYDVTSHPQLIVTDLRRICRVTVSLPPTLSSSPYEPRYVLVNAFPYHLCHSRTSD